MLVVATGGLGCERPASTSDLSATSPTKPSPEESFQLIFETFRRGLEDVPIGFVLRKEGGHSMMVGKNEVSYELLRPATAGDPYKAIITVDSQSRYSIQRSTEEAAEAGREEDAANQSADNVLAEPGEASGIEILDPELVGAPAEGAPSRRSTPGAGEGTVARRPDEEVRKYELVYEDGRWTLTTELNPETEQSIRNAFDRALNTQI